MSVFNIWDETQQKYVPLPAIKGKDGRGIQSFTYNVETDKWVVTYTDGTSENIQGPSIESGVDGKDGRGMQSLTYSSTTNLWTVTYTDGTSATVSGPEIPTLLSELTGDATHRVVTDAQIAAWDGKSEFSGSYNDLTEVPSSFTPADHNQAASTITSGTFVAARIPSLAASKITAGTFSGKVVAGSSYQTPGTYLLRNSQVATSEATPTVNGQISWLAE